jgi:hypothetical protein
METYHVLSITVNYHSLNVFRNLKKNEYDIAVDVGLLLLLLDDFLCLWSQRVAVTHLVSHGKG